MTIFLMKAKGKRDYFYDNDVVISTPELKQPALRAFCFFLRPVIKMPNRFSSGQSKFRWAHLQAAFPSSTTQTPAFRHCTSRQAPEGPVVPGPWVVVPGGRVVAGRG